MAEKTILSSCAQGKALLPEVLDSVGIIQDEGAFFVSSKDVALHFQKKHKHVLDEIHKIISITPKSFHEPNFRPMSIAVEIGNGAIRKDPAYLLTRDAFSLLAMGFTGSAAIRWKLKYIAAFNALEQAALARARHNALQEALRLHRRMTPERLSLVRKAMRYRGLGLSLREIGKLIDRKTTCVHDLLKDGRMLAPEARP